MKPTINKYMFSTAARMAVLLVTVWFSLPAWSQPHVSVNISVQPLWGPVGYDYVDYYYLPAYEVYYYVPRHQFVYLDGSHWIFAAALPPRFGAIDLYATHKVVINEPRAYLNYKVHKVKYVAAGLMPQTVIRDSRDEKYYVVRGTPITVRERKWRVPMNGTAKDTATDMAKDTEKGMEEVTVKAGSTNYALGPVSAMGFILRFTCKRKL